MLKIANSKFQMCTSTYCTASGDPVKEILRSGRPALSVMENSSMYYSKSNYKLLFIYKLSKTGVNISIELTVRNLDLAARILLYFVNLFTSSAND